MSWKRPMSIMVVAILASLPVSRTLCALLCETAGSASGSSAHHGSADHCHEQAAAVFPEVHSSGTAGHDCGAHGAILQYASSPAADRVASIVVSHWLAAWVLHLPGPVVDLPGQVMAIGAPPGNLPPTATPLVLRV